MKSYWHRPGCTWATSKSDPKTTPRDQDCPACRDDGSDPYEYNLREMMWQQKRELVEMKKMIEKDPYEVFFGMSNHRIRSLWGSTDYPTPWQLLGGPLCNSTASPRIPLAVRRVSVEETQSQKPEPGMERKSSTNVPHSVGKPSTGPAATNHSSMPIPKVQASIEWSSSRIDSRGTTHVDSGKLVYDPISGRMVPTDSPKEVTTNAEVANKIVKAPVTKELHPSNTAIDKNSIPSTDPVDLAKENGSSQKQSILPENGNKTVTQSSSMIEARSAEPKSPMSELSRDVRIRSSLERHVETSSQGGLGRQEQVNADARYRQSEADARRQKSTEKRLQDTDRRRARAEAWVAFNNARQSQTSSHSPSQASQDKTRRPRSDDSVTASPTKELFTSCRQQEPFIPRSLRSTKPNRPWQSLEGPSSRGAVSVFQKVKPLKSMTQWELKSHRAALMESWGTSRTTSMIPSLADKRLEEEVKAQKNAMTGFENKWGKRQAPEESTNTAKESVKTKEHADLTRPHPSSKRHPVELLAGEGDMCPNVVDFAKTDRWYKKKALHALRSEEQEMRDRQLVCDIRSVYESAYGTIDKAHRQASLLPLEAETSPVPQQAEAGMPSPQAEPQTTTFADQQYEKPLLDPSYSTVDGLPSARYNSDNFEIRAYVLHPDADNAIIRTPLSSLPAMRNELPQLQQYITGPPWSLAQALTNLHDPSCFADFLIRKGKLDEQIVFARGNELVTRVPRVSSSPQPSSSLPPSPPLASRPSSIPTQRSVTLSEAARDYRKRSQINPIDGTTAATPNPIPQTGNFASPTGFVNHDVITPQPKPTSSPSMSKNDRKVRKEEPVFSGSIPVQKYSVPEIQAMLNRKDFAWPADLAWPEDASSANPPANPPANFENGKDAGNRSNRRHKRHQKSSGRKFFRGVKRILLVGTWTAGCCYATGVVIEYFRTDQVEAADKSKISWGDGMWGTLKKDQAPRYTLMSFKQEPNDARPIAKSNEAPGMPLHGMEYPLMGVLAACVWYLWSGGR